MADVAVVAVEDATSFTDLPGVERFELLTPTLQTSVLERANHARCDCGCPGHSVNACLHQQELCDVALGLARGFVADAEVLALTAPEAAGDPAPAESPSATSGSAASASDAAGVAPAPGAVPGAAPGTGPGDAASDPQPAPDGASPAPEETAVPPSEGDSAPGAPAADER